MNDPARARLPPFRFEIPQSPRRDYSTGYSRWWGEVYYWSRPSIKNTFCPGKSYFAFSHSMKLLGGLPIVYFPDKHLSPFRRQVPFTFHGDLLFGLLRSIRLLTALNRLNRSLCPSYRKGTTIVVLSNRAPLGGALTTSLALQLPNERSKWPDYDFS